MQSLELVSFFSKLVWRKARKSFIFTTISGPQLLLPSSVTNLSLSHSVLAYSTELHLKVELTGALIQSGSHWTLNQSWWQANLVKKLRMSLWTKENIPLVTAMHGLSVLNTRKRLESQMLTLLISRFKPANKLISKQFCNQAWLMVLQFSKLITTI